MMLEKRLSDVALASIHSEKTHLKKLIMMKMIIIIIINRKKLRFLVGARN